MRHLITTFAMASLITAVACQDSDPLAGPHEFAVPGPAYALSAPDYCDGSTMPVAECEALIVLYNTTGGESWTTPADHPWGDDPNPCTWWAIVCAGGDHGSVLEINLIGDGLTGTIPSEIGQLSSLTHLRLGSNDLWGLLPGTIANLQDLVMIELTGNHHSGPIPEWLGDLPNLKYFFAWGNDFSGPIPAELANAQSLEFVILDNNDLSGAIPAELGTLSGLTYFSAPHNQLSGVLPLEFAALADGMEEGCNLGHNPGLSIPDIQAYRDLDTDGDGELCGLSFSSPEDIGGDAVGGIEDLVPDPLTAGQANALTTKIENAMAKAAKGQYQAAINQMVAFISQLQDMVAEGVLTQEQADPFLQQAQALIDLWTAEL
jgi:hypothetical protein